MRGAKSHPSSFASQSLIAPRSIPHPAFHMRIVGRDDIDMHVFIGPNKNETLWQILAVLTLGIYLGNIIRKPTACLY